MQTVQISLQHLKNIIASAEQNIKRDSSLSTVVTIEVTEPTDLHLGQDSVKVRQLSSYAEANGVLIGY